MLTWRDPVVVAGRRFVVEQGGADRGATCCAVVVRTAAAMETKIFPSVSTGGHLIRQWIDGRLIALNTRQNN